MYLFNSVWGEKGILWHWVKEVLFPNLLPKRCSVLKGSGGRWEPQFSERSVWKKTLSKMGRDASHEWSGILGVRSVSQTHCPV